MFVSDSLLFDEATNELISDGRKCFGVECLDDDSQVINVKIEDISYDMSDNAILKLQFRLCYKYRKLLDIALLGCRMKVFTKLTSPSERSLKIMMQKRMNMICDGNCIICIRMFFKNINQLINMCKWIVSIQDVYPICTLYHMRDTLVSDGE